MNVSDEIEKEKRYYMRFDVHADVICKKEDSLESFTGNCVNLSYSGIRFITTTLLKEGTKLDIKAKVDSGVFQPLKAKMVVNSVKRLAGNKYLVTGEMNEVK